MPSRRSLPWSDLDPERRNAVLLIGGIGLIVVFALALIGFGYYTDRVRPQHETVVRLGDTTMDYSYLERRVKSEIARGVISQQNLAQGIYNTLELIQREELQRQTARRLGLEITEEDILARYRSKIGLPSSATPEVMAPLLRAELIRMELSLAELRNIAIAEASRRKLEEKFLAEAPSSSEHVEIHLLKVEAQAAALQAKERIEKGEEFAFVAAEVSIDSSGKEHGGDLSWTPRAALPKEVGDAAVSIELNKLSDVIETPLAFYLIRVTGRETRDLSDAAKEDVAAQKMEDELYKTRDEGGLEVTLTDQQIQRLALAVQPNLG